MPPTLQMLPYWRLGAGDRPAGMYRSFLKKSLKILANVCRSGSIIKGINLGTSL